MSTIPTVEQEVEITFLQSDSCTVAQVEFDGLCVTGSTKRKPGDKRKESVGLDLAIARAFLALGDAMASRHGYNFEPVELKESK